MFTHVTCLARHVSHVSARKRDKICLTTLFFSHPSALVLFQPISLTLMQVTVHSFCLLSKSSPNKSWDERGINQEHFCYSVFVHKSRVSATSLKFTGHKCLFRKWAWCRSKILSNEAREETVSLLGSSKVKSKWDCDPLLEPDPTSKVRGGVDGSLEQEVRVRGQGSHWGGALAAERELG